MADAPVLDPDLTIIEVDYESGTPDPGRVFRAIAELIEAFHAIDRDLARAVSVSVHADVLLERVEAGSIKAVIRTLLQHTDDDALKNLDWKPLVGQYLVKAKHAILRALDGKDKISSRAEVIELGPQGTDGPDLRRARDLKGKGVNVTGKGLGGGHNLQEDALTAE